MAGYSGTPLPKKLGIKEGANVGFVRPPADFAATLGDLPAGVSPRAGESAAAVGAGPFDVLVCFVCALEQLKRDLPALQKRLQPAGGLWIAWPKRTVKKSATALVSDISENEVRARALAAGLVDNKVCAIDEVWSGLRLVVRLVDRPKQQSGPTTQSGPKNQVRRS